MEGEAVKKIYMVWYQNIHRFTGDFCSVYGSRFDISGVDVFRKFFDQTIMQDIMQVDEKEMHVAHVSAN
jgi:hypothetical protein